MSTDDRVKELGGIAALRLRHGGAARRRFVRLDGSKGPRLEPETPVGRDAGRIEEFLLRAANLVVTVMAFIVLLPVIIVIAVAVRLDSPGPVIYRQLRVGLDRRGRLDIRDSTGRRVNDLGGRPFMIYKFRTMRVDAEFDSGPVWARTDDDRATRVGRVLRKTRMDEIPQFGNVLKGDMAVVGPRPERPNFVLELQKEIDGYRLRNRVKPGITGWAQVNRPSDQTMEDVREKVDFDIEYVRRRSLWFDLMIMLKTLPVMFEHENSLEADDSDDVQ
jgi:lipopolysaccharide/colanic/teichoic acid biosynthesis glycosyltransferase